MTLPVMWLPEANAELLEARAWYDNVGSSLGDRFALAIEATTTAITQHPLQFPIVHREIRRAGVRRFPYGVFFQVQDSRILVVACFHGRRNPRHWQARG